MSVHPASVVPRKAMSQLVSLASRQGKVSRVCLAHQAPRERREPGAMTVSESPRMPHFSVQKA